MLPSNPVAERGADPAGVLNNAHCPLHGCRASWIGNSSNCAEEGSLCMARLAVADAAGAWILGSDWVDVWHAVLAASGTRSCQV